jgi:hypothetical protein
MGDMMQLNLPVLFVDHYGCLFQIHQMFMLHLQQVEADPLRLELIVKGNND